MVDKFGLDENTYGYPLVVFYFVSLAIFLVVRHILGLIHVVGVRHPAYLIGVGLIVWREKCRNLLLGNMDFRIFSFYIIVYKIIKTITQHLMT